MNVQNSQGLIRVYLAPSQNAFVPSHRDTRCRTMHLGAGIWCEMVYTAVMDPHTSWV